MLAAPLGLQAAAGNAALGKEKADSERCLECHGEAGAGQGMSQGTDGKFARLDGQYADYMIKQVKDFRSGARKHDFMTMMAKTLDDADLVDIAAYFAAEPVRRGSGAPAPLADPAAQRLFEQGDPARGLIACTTCHGAGGQGGGAAGPVLRGQGQAYLVQQLHEWRNGTRRNSPGGIMNQQAKALTDTDIAALARYLSSL